MKGKVLGRWTLSMRLEVLPNNPVDGDVHVML